MSQRNIDDDAEWDDFLGKLDALVMKWGRSRRPGMSRAADVFAECADELERLLGEAPALDTDGGTG